MFRLWAWVLRLSALRMMYRMLGSLKQPYLHWLSLWQVLCLDLVKASTSSRIPENLTCHKIMDLDDILDNVMSEPVVAVVAPKPPVVKKPAESAEIKPWLASTANVPPEFRDRWTKLVRADLSAVAATPFQTSHAYRNWWEASGTPSSNKVLLDLVRKAAAKCGLDDIQTAQLSNSSNPITDR